MNKLMKLFKDHIDFPDDHTKVCWAIICDELMYNTENDVDDLMSQNGSTYSGEIKGQLVEINGYVLSTIDSGCGYDYQAIFSKALCVDEEEYWESKED